MKTYDTIYQIENRIDPRRRMIYITPPFTSMLEDINLMSAEMVVATQKSLLKQEMMYAREALTMFLSGIGQRRVPELDSGAIITNHI